MREAGTDPMALSVTAREHAAYDEAVTRMRALIGRTHQLYLDGADREATRVRPKHSPTDRGLVLGNFPAAIEHEVAMAIEAAHRAFGAWASATPSDRRGVVRRLGEAIESRASDFAAVLSMEVGKNRREALREVYGTTELLVSYCDEWASHGFAPDPERPHTRARGHHEEVGPHGVWAVFAPFHHPLAMAAAPCAAALLAGNSVVLKAPEEAPWTARLLADAFHAAGAPAGTFNLLMGSPEDMGDAMFHDARIAGATYTGSSGPAERLAASLRARSGTVRHPCILEVTTKAARVVTAQADLDLAASSIARAAFGMTGLRASAPSHCFVHDEVADAFLERLVAHTERLRVGDPTRPDTDVGPVVSSHDYLEYRAAAHLLRDLGGRVHAGGRVLDEHGLGAGNFVAPTVAEVPVDHPCWSQEMMQPILFVRRYHNPELAAATIAKLGRPRMLRVHGTAREERWFHRTVEARRGQATTSIASSWPTLFPFMRADDTIAATVQSLHDYLAQYLAVRLVPDAH